MNNMATHILIFKGTRTYKQSLDFLVWSHCYLEHAYVTTSFFPQELDTAASAVLGELGMSRQEITVSNARAVYLHLCNIMSQ